MNWNNWDNLIITQKKSSGYKQDLKKHSFNAYQFWIKPDENIYDKRISNKIFHNTKKRECNKPLYGVIRILNRSKPSIGGQKHKHDQLKRFY